MSDNQIKYLLRTGILRGIPTTAQESDPQEKKQKQKEKKQKTQRTKKAKTKTSRNTKAWKEFRKRFAWVNELLEKSEREKL